MLPVSQVATCGVWRRTWTRAQEGRQEAVPRHGEEDAGLAHDQDEEDAGDAGDGPDADEG